jgi:hypothetical protein
MIFKAGDKEYTLKYKFASLRKLETIAGMPVSSLLKEDNMGFDTMALFIWAGLIHENKRLTQDELDEIIDLYLQGEHEEEIEDKETKEKERVIVDNDFADLMGMATKAFEVAGFGAKKKTKKLENKQK